MRSGRETFQHSAETVRSTLESAAKVASRITEESVSQFMSGFSGEGGKKAAQRSLRDIEGIVQSGMTVTESMQRCLDECTNITRARVERGFDRIGALTRCRTPQEFTALQSEALRDNIETFLGFARKLGEHSTRLADEAKQRFDSLAEGRGAA
jgi:hypothetical protein